MTLFATLLLSVVLTGNGINDLDYKLMFILFLFYEIFGLFTSQSFSLQGELIKTNPLWSMSLDSLIAWSLLHIMPNSLVNFFGVNISIICIITYIITPTNNNCIVVLLDGGIEIVFYQAYE